MNEFLRHGDWKERAQRYREAREMFAWDAERQRSLGRADYGEADYYGHRSVPFSRLFEELGDPLVMEPDGRFGPMPFDPKGFSSRMELSRSCGRVGFDRMHEVYGFEQLSDEDFRLLLWPWVAKMADRYADSLRTFDRDKDLKPSQLDAMLAQIDLDAARLSENLARIQEAERLNRAWHPSEYKRRLYLISVRATLNKGAGAVGPFGLEHLASKLTQLGRAARGLRGKVEDMPPTTKVTNAGKEALTIGAAYMWDALGGTVSAARRTSTRRGEESNFVLFVQSIARLTSNDIPTIAQVEAALKVDWPAFEAMTDVMFHHVDSDEIETG